MEIILRLHAVKDGLPPASAEVLAWYDKYVDDGFACCYDHAEEKWLTANGDRMPPPAYWCAWPVLPPPLFQE